MFIICLDEFVVCGLYCGLIAIYSMAINLTTGKQLWALEQGLSTGY